MLWVPSKAVKVLLKNPSMAPVGWSPPAKISIVYNKVPLMSFLTWRENNFEINAECQNMFVFDCVIQHQLNGVYEAEILCKITALFQPQNQKLRLLN